MAVQAEIYIDNHVFCANIITGSSKPSCPMRASAASNQNYGKVRDLLRHSIGE